METQEIDDRPNPNDYSDTIEEQQQWIDDYWLGDIEAMLYHEDEGDR